MTWYEEKKPDYAISYIECRFVGVYWKKLDKNYKPT